MHFLRYSFHTERELVKRKGVGTKHFNQNNSPIFSLSFCKATIKAFHGTRFEMNSGYWFLLTEMLLVMMYRCAQYKIKNKVYRREEYIEITQHFSKRRRRRSEGEINHVSQASMSYTLSIIITVASLTLYLVHLNGKRI